MSAITCPACLHSTPVLSRGGDAQVVCLRCRAPIPAELLAPTEPLPEGAEPAPTPAVHAVESFVAAPGGSPGGVLVALAFGLVTAAVLGFAAALLREHFWLVLVFAGIYGAALGGATGAGAWVGKCRLRGAVIAAGAVTGLAGALLLHYFGYVLAQRELPQLQLYTFWEYMDLRCEAGSSIGSMNLGYAGTAIYWSVEALLVVILSGAVATWPLSRPFCAGCNAWKTQTPLGTFRIDGARALQAVAAGQPAAMVGPAAGDERVTVAVYRCPQCGPAGGIEAQVTCVRGSGEQATSMTLCMSYPGAALADFEEVARSCREQGLEVKA